MKKIFLSFVLAILLLVGLGPSISFAKNRLPLFESTYDPILKSNIIKDTIDNEYDNIGTQDSFRELFIRRGGEDRSLLLAINVILGGIAILWLVVVGVKFMFTNGNEEEMTKAKTQIAWIILGLATISVAEYVAFGLLDPTTASTDLTSDTGSKILGAKVAQIKLFVEIIITSVMLIMLGISGYRLIIGDENEALENEKKFLKTFAFGTVLLLMAEVIVKVASNTDTKEGVVKASYEIVGIINYVFSFIAVASTAMLILASVYFVSNFGNEEQASRAKKIIIASILGIVVAISSYAISTFVVRGL